MTDIQIIDQEEYNDKQSKAKHLQELLEQHIDDSELKSELLNEIHHALLDDIIKEKNS